MLLRLHIHIELPKLLSEILNAGLSKYWTATGQILLPDLDFHSGAHLAQCPSPTQAGPGIPAFLPGARTAVLSRLGAVEPKKKWHGRFEALGVKLLYVFTPMLRLVYGGQSKNYKATSLLRKE